MSKKLERFKLTKKLKAKWLEALKSGKYIQGTGALQKKDKHDEITHCCLGVLCDIMPDVKIMHKSSDGFPNELNSIEGYLEKSGEGEDNSYRWLRSIDPSYNFIKDNRDTNIISNIISKNDNYCDSKYTKVIPLVEKLPTCD